MRLSFAKSTFFAVLIPSAVFLAGCGASNPRSKGLEVIYGAQGIERLSYRGVVLEDLAQYPDDAFHIWHMKATDLQGNVVAEKQYQWGEVNAARSWDMVKHTWKYFFDWGTISVEFAQVGDTLNINVTEANNPDSKVIFDGATIYPFVLHFPRLPDGFKDVKFAQLSTNSNSDQAASRMVVADYGEGQIVSFVPDPAGPLYHGFDPPNSDAAASGFNYVPIVSSTSMDSMPSFFPRIDRPVRPGKDDRFTVSLRFAPSGTPISGLQ
jgi:hypothetical protein